MTRTRWLPALTSVLLIGGALRAAQDPAATNPALHNRHLGNRESIRSGQMMYRLRCGDCHGLDASGYRGPDLKAALAGGLTDERLFQTIRNGVPGTEMPKRNERDEPDDELLMIIAYLRDLSSVAPAEAVVGNVENGKRLFAAQCASCHRVAGQGGRLGPDLTRIGAARSRAALVREIRTPSEWTAPGFESVTLVFKDGRRVRGTKKNEDTFSVQVMDTRERIQGYLKSDLQEIVYDKGSLMPVFDSGRLNDSDLQDVVGFLTTLRGVDVAVR